MNKRLEIATRYQKLVIDMNDLIDDITEERNQLLKVSNDLKEENQQLRRLLTSKFKSKNLDVELKHLDIKI